MKKYIFIFKIFILFTSTLCMPYNLAVIKYPVIDMCNNFHDPENLPISNETNVNRCDRTHQGLFNELVHLVELRQNYVKVFFDNIKNLMPADTPSFFWTHKDNLIPLENLKENIIVQSIPNSLYAQEPTITITYPWKNFSVGTRFKHFSKLDTKKSYGIIRADFIKNKIILDRIPRSNALQETKQSKKSARKLFVKIINDMIDRINKSNLNQVVPYVWGGCSFTKLYQSNNFYKKDGVWHRQGKNNPYSGFDCSGFIMKMAQIAGLDFPWQTSTAMQFSMKKLAENDLLQEGDILWINGHVIIISSIQRNEIIEARGYSDGYGCLHRIKLSQLLKDITNYDQLLDYYYAKKQITFKKKVGEHIESDSFELLKLTA